MWIRGLQPASWIPPSGDAKCGFIAGLRVFRLIEFHALVGDVAAFVHDTNLPCAFTWTLGIIATGFAGPAPTP